MLNRLIALFIAPFGLAAQTTPAVAPPQVTTSATAEVQLKPDRATLSFSVESRGSTAAKAGAETARRQRAVLDTIRSLGVAADQMTTASIQINPEFAYDAKPPRLVGYVARNTVRVEVREIEKVGMLIDGALAKEATGIGSLYFGSSKEDEARRQALELAVVKAHGEAEAMAHAAGGSLGGLIELNAEQASPRIQTMMAAAAPAVNRAIEQTPVAPGQLTVSATISGRWGFLPR